LRHSKRKPSKEIDMKRINKLAVLSLLAASATSFAQTSTAPATAPAKSPAGTTTAPTGQPTNPAVVQPAQIGQQPTATNPVPPVNSPLQPTTLPSSPPTSSVPPNTMTNPTGSIPPGTNPAGSVTTNPTGNPVPGSLPAPTNPAGNPATGAASRQPPIVNGQANVFGSLDQSHKGYLNKADVASNQFLSGHFQQCDTNGDGQLSSQEVSSCSGGH
jgi:hypothetical protein